MADLDARDHVTGKQAPVTSIDKALRTTSATLLSGEDQTNNVLKVENQNEYVAITQSASADVDIEHIVGGPGDLIVGLHFNTNTTENVIIMDGTTDVFTIPTASAQAGDVWSAPGGGVVATTKWVLKTTTADTTTIICVGRFG